MLEPPHVVGAAPSEAHIDVCLCRSTLSVFAAQAWTSWRCIFSLKWVGNVPLTRFYFCPDSVALFSHGLCSSGEHYFSTGTDLSEQSSELSCLQRHNVRVLGTGKQLMFLAHGFGTNQQVSRRSCGRCSSTSVLPEVLLGVHRLAFVQCCAVALLYSAVVLQGGWTEGFVQNVQMQSQD